MSNVQSLSIDLEHLRETLDVGEQINLVGSIVGACLIIEAFIKVKEFATLDQAKDVCQTGLRPRLSRLQAIGTLAQVILSPEVLACAVSAVWQHCFDESRPKYMGPSLDRVLKAMTNNTSHEFRAACSAHADYIYRAFQALVAKDRALAEVSEPLECEICYDQIKDPVKLNVCGHIFCHECTWKWIGRGKGALAEPVPPTPETNKPRKLGAKKAKKADESLEEGVARDEFCFEITHPAPKGKRKRKSDELQDIATSGEDVNSRKRVHAQEEATPLEAKIHAVAQDMRESAMHGPNTI
ncbi:hypothetical protein P154DRAFT_528729 [Amniculicola lignicola CBS 123094]|uniref:RING-type domain-containing protein n=1 Tax=Amniculicola lignicola CBS 123094 TaxID=1392246 RepID=A0A6A5X5L5_9PLEO|nr:hypothetical protein P154DRAFT_528729 [Amniculicola lignicola CBS 123094]